MGLKRNFLYNGVLTLSGYLFPLLTYPYVSRVLGVSNIGICNFVDSIINYFILFSMMGIGAVGMREISQHRDDRQEMSRHFSGLLTLNLLTTALAAIILVTVILVVPSLSPYSDLLYIGVCKLFFNFFLIEWFYAGVEDFKYITIRSIIVRTIYVLLVFILIKQPEDYKLYYFLTVSTYFLNGVINIFYCRRYVRPTLKNIHIRPYLKTFLTIGLYMLITNVYTSLNVTWLGFATDTKEVGEYTTATKLYTIILALFTALTNVVYPRVTYLHAKGQEAEFWEKIGKAVSIVFVVSIPLAGFLAVFHSNMIHLLAGDGYEGAYIPFLIISPLILIIGYEQVLVIQILMAMKQDKQITLNSIIGASVTIILNLLIVGKLGAIGTSLTWVLTELVITLLSLKTIYQLTSYRFPATDFMRILTFNLPLFAILSAIECTLPLPDILLLALCATIAALYTLYIQVRWLRNEMVIQTINSLMRFLRNKLHGRNC